MREYNTIRALMKGEVIEFEGVKFKKEVGEIGPGDTYIAERNTKPKLLTCYKNDKDKGYIVPVEFPAYSFDTNECVKVKMLD